MNGESTDFQSGAQSYGGSGTRLADAEGLYAATAMLMAEGRDKGFHFFALHLAVALRELEDQVGRPMPAAAERQTRLKPKASAAMRRLIRGEEAG